MQTGRKYRHHASRIRVLARSPPVIPGLNKPSIGAIKQLTAKTPCIRNRIFSIWSAFRPLFMTKEIKNVESDIKQYPRRS